MKPSDARLSQLPANFARQSQQWQDELGEYQPTHPQQRTIFKPRIYGGHGLDKFMGFLWFWGGLLWILYTVVVQDVTGFETAIKVICGGALLLAVFKWLRLLAHRGIDSGVGATLLQVIIGMGGLAACLWLGIQTQNQLCGVVFIGLFFFLLAFRWNFSRTISTRRRDWEYHQKSYQRGNGQGVTWHEDAMGRSWGFDQDGKYLDGGGDNGLHRK
jgi:hypothetical protein